jgi:hypothetical protein
MEKLRWRIANLLDKLPGQCWADLCDWALGNRDYRSPNPWSPIGPSCREDLARVGSCYCGKLRAASPGCPACHGTTWCPGCAIEPDEVA